jgi:hypothetical protein
MQLDTVTGFARAELSPLSGSSEYSVSNTQYLESCARSSFRDDRERNRYRPSMNQRPLCLVAVSLLVAGCQPPPSIATDSEQTLPTQIALVQSGKSDRIHLEHTPLSDADLKPLADLTELRELLIDDPSSAISATGLRHLARLPKLEHLRVRSSMDDDALTAIGDLKTLKILNAPRTTFSDAALAVLKSLPSLESFRFGSHNITDAGMQTLAELTAIRRLHLIDVPITDEGLRTLAKIEQLESLYIDGAELSDAAFDELFRQHPSVHVHVNQEHHDRDPHAHP